VDTFVISGLVRKRADLAGEIERTQTALQSMIRDLENLDATIRLFDADYQVEAIKPKAFRPPEDWAHRGEMTRIILDTLRQAAEPLTSRDVAVALMQARALDATNVKFLRLMTKRVGVALRLQRDKGVAKSNQGPGQYLTWEIAR
jgi:hypothetical protein